MARKLKIMEKEKHLLDNLKNDPALVSGGWVLTGACGNGWCPVTQAFTVRCVLDLDF